MAPPAGERGSVAAGDAATERSEEVPLGIRAPLPWFYTAPSPTACLASCRRFPLRGLSCRMVVARRGVALSFNSLRRGLRFVKTPHRGVFPSLTLLVRGAVLPQATRINNLLFVFSIVDRGSNFFQKPLLILSGCDIIWAPHKIKTCLFFKKWAFYYGKNADFSFSIS